MDDRGNFYTDDSKLRELIAERSGTTPRPMKDAPMLTIETPLDIAYLNRSGRRAFFAARRQGKSEDEARQIAEKASRR
jgi:hypothetical protein